MWIQGIHLLPNNRKFDLAFLYYWLARYDDNSIIQNVTTFDVYEGDNIPKDKKSVAINITLQAANKTLSEQDLDKISKKKIVYKIYSIDIGTLNKL